MKKSLFTLFLLVAMASLPAVVSAQTGGDVQSQIKALMEQINALRAQLGTAQIQGGQSSGDVDPDGMSGGCVDIKYNLRYRSTDESVNGEVSLLQDFLQSRGYLKSEPTGYFGLLTVAASKGFQRANAILDSGYVGPVTRAKIKEISCGGGMASIINPLPVQMTPPSVEPTALLPKGCIPGYLFSPLTGQKCVPESEMIEPRTMFSALPSYGAAPLLVYFNTSASTDNGELTIDFGDGQVSIFEKGLTHYYTSPGTYVATLTQQPLFVCNAPPGAACMQVMPAPRQIGSVTISVVEQNSSVPVVNGVDGPALLNVGQIGTWTVRASVLNQPGAQLSYAVRWGDEEFLLAPVALNQSVAPVRTSATFTHAYQKNGVYQPKFTVSNSAGSASAGMTVTVGDQDNAAKVSVPGFGGQTYGIGDNVIWYAYVENGPSSGRVCLSLTKDDVGFVSFPPGQTECPVVGSTGKVSFSGIIPNYGMSAGVYHLKAELYDVNAWSGGYGFPLATGLSGEFNITDNQSAGITVIEPKGGGYWYRGNTEAVQWTTVGIPEDNQMLIRLRSVELGQEYNLVTTSNDGVEKILVPLSIPLGAYTLEIKTSVGGRSYMGASYSPFKVIVPTSSRGEVVVSQKSLTLVYDSSKKESALEAKYTVNITAGSGNLTVNKSGSGSLPNSWTIFTDLAKQDGADPRVSGGAITVSPQNSSAIDNGAYWTILAGQTATFSVFRSWNPKLLFAGQYYSRVGHIIYPQTSTETIISVTDGSTNFLTVVGETSPYVTSITPLTNVLASGSTGPTAQSFLISGVRLSGTTVSMAQNTGIAPYGVTDTAMSFTAPALVDGSYQVQVIHPTTGASNKYYANVTNTPQTTITPAVNIAGAPILQLAYDSVGAESILTATYNVDITAGSGGPILLNKPGYYAGTNSSSLAIQLLNYNLGYAARTADGQLSITAGPFAGIDNGTYWTIPAGQTAKFVVIYATDPKRLFAGTYYGRLSFSGNIPLASNQTNSKVIVGEVSPYIISISPSYPTTVLPGQMITLAGARLSNSVLKVGTLTITPSSSSDMQITFTVPASTSLSAGAYSVQLFNSSTGNSNTMSINIGQVAQPESSPGLNYMSCANPLKTGGGGGVIGCYGLWDYGESFGGDQNMCPAWDYFSSGTTGCTVSTNACASGQAVASRVISVSGASLNDLNQLATNLRTTVSVIQANLVRAWEYTCQSPATSSTAAITSSLTSTANTSTTVSFGSAPRRSDFDNWRLQNLANILIALRGILKDF